MEFNVKTNERYFLVPEMPTPNGRMHLGHISGPYLKMDILKRKVIRNGGQAFIASGSDVYESYVELKSQQTGRQIADICNDFHERIKDDLRALSIEMDMFINPLDTSINKNFILHHNKMVEELEDNGSLINVEETFHYNAENGRYLTGCWISGKCPECGSNSGSYLCENCGTHYKPMDVFDSTNYPKAIPQIRTSKFLTFDGNLMVSNLEKMGVEKAFIDIFRKYLKSQGEQVRLTTQQQIGVQYKDTDQVLFTYTSLWFFSVYCGELAKEQFGLKENPFANESDFITVASFGIDNAIPYLGGVYGAGLASKQHKPFDCLLSNFFYHLNGAKFSTSRLHVIWGKDIIDRGEISTDLARYYLTLVNPQSETKNFDLDEFVYKTNTLLVDRHNTIIQHISRKIEPHLNMNVLESFPVKWFELLEKLLQRQDESLNPFKFQLKNICETLDDWFELYNENFTASESFWWLKTYSLLSNPVLPEMSSNISQKLCQKPRLTLIDFFETENNVFADLFDLQYTSIQLEKLQLCLVGNEL